ncbi:MAG: hypothetical protein ABFS38_02575 [Bacteroidota bacterium]
MKEIYIELTYDNLQVYFLIFLAILILTGWTESDDQMKPIIYEVPTLSAKMVIDGMLDEPAWSAASSIKGFYNSDNTNPSMIDIEVLLASDGENLIVGLEMPLFENDLDPEKCYLSDEPDLRPTPNVAISLDPGHRHGVYYRFIIDSEGRKQDLRVDDESWSTEWSAITNQDGSRFSAEIQIPIHQLSSLDVEGEFWGFNISLKGIFSNEIFHTTPMGLRYADAANFGHLLFTGALNKKQIEELKYALPAIHKSKEENRVAANALLCGPELEEIPEELEDMETGVEFRLRDGTNITCLGLDNLPVIRSNFPFFYEKFESPDLQRLRNQYNLNEIIASGKNDFEQILLLNEWLVNHVPFGSPPPITPQALQVLYYGLNGQTFYCTYLSFTLMQMYCSLGFTARKMTSVGHGTLDVWSNYWRKWMQIDPSRNSYFRMAGTAIPLNSNEIRREFYRNGGVDMEMVFGTEQRAERVTLERRARDGAYRYRQDGYAWVAYKSRNNFFEIPFAYWNFDYLIAEDEYSLNQTWQHRGDMDIREKLGTRTSRIGDIFWTLNQAFIHLYDQGSSDFKVQLETHTPNFKSFEVSIDHGEWQTSDPVFSWDLHDGQNHLKARSVNKFGVAGPAHKIVLKVNLD